MLTQNQRALEGLNYGADDFDLPIEDEVTQKAGATISLDFERILNYARELGYEPEYRHVSLGQRRLGQYSPPRVRAGLAVDMEIASATGGAVRGSASVMIASATPCLRE